MSKITAEHLSRRACVIFFDVVCPRLWSRQNIFAARLVAPYVGAWAMCPVSPARKFLKALNWSWWNPLILRWFNECFE